jgi:hypothetical protein
MCTCGIVVAKLLATTLRREKLPSECDGTGTILCLFFIEKHKIILLIPEYLLSLPSVRGEIRTNKEAFAIISRIAKKSVGNSDWYNKHGNNK